MCVCVHDWGGGGGGRIQPIQLIFLAKLLGGGGFVVLLTYAVELL